MKTSLKTGAVALAFLILGFELALFVQRAAEARIVANRDRPDTVYLFQQSGTDSRLTEGADSQDLRHAGPGGRDSSPERGEPASFGGQKRDASGHSAAARAIYEHSPKRRVESFRFNPNTVSLQDLCRLGFTEKQAHSIISYREKGGRFRRKGDFAKSFVVSDSVYRRLEPFIDIPKVDINKADSASFDTLPGIGGWFAHRMVEYREQLRGYSCPEQLMEIWHFDKEKFDGLKDLIICSQVEPYPFWSGSLEDIRSHPHIRNYQIARDIVFFRDHNPPENLTIDALLEAGIISADQARRLRLCRLK